MKIHEVDDIITDERGAIIQVASGDWKQLNIVTSKRGTLRGGHYHREAVELFYVFKGRLEVKSINVLNNDNESRVYEETQCFTIHPEEQHYMKFIDDTVLLILYSTVFNTANPDIYVAENLPGLKDIFSQ